MARLRLPSLSCGPRGAASLTRALWLVLLAAPPPVRCPRSLLSRAKEAELWRMAAARDWACAARPGVAHRQHSVQRDSRSSQATNDQIIFLTFTKLCRNVMN